MKIKKRKRKGDGGGGNCSRLKEMKRHNLGFLTGFWSDKNNHKGHFLVGNWEIHVSTGYWMRIENIHVNFVKCGDSTVVIQKHECLYFWIYVTKYLGGC